MRWSWWCRDAVLTLLVLVAASTPAPRAQTPPTLFDETRAADAAVAAADRGPVRRSRRLRPDPVTLEGLFGGAAVDRPPARLNLFPDVQLAMVRERLEASRHGQTTWVGHAEGDATSTIALTWDGASLSGGVVAGGVAYQLSGGAAGVSIDERAVAAPANELPSPEAPPPDGIGGGLPPAAGADGSSAAIDLLVVYTTAARTRAGGTSAIESQLANAVAVTNTAFERSGVAAVLTSVGFQELPYAESPAGPGADLYAISPGGAINATIEAMRAVTGADLVALVTGRQSSSGGCGVAWIGPSSDYAFSVTEQACLVAGQWTFSHELGHNFGARHAAGDSSDTSPACPSYPCGYRDGDVRTLMAYYVSGSAISRVLNYSSATVREPAATGLATGSPLHDNARRLGETAGAIAAYRAAVPRPAVPGAPRAFTAAVDGATVTLNWLPPLDGGAVTAYELEVGSSAGAANLLRSTVAGAPIPAAGVPAGTYHVRVRSLGPGGRSAPTPDAVVIVGAGGCAPPGAVTLSGGASAGVVALAWTAAAGSGPLTYYLGAGSGPGALDRGVFTMGAARSFAVAVAPGLYYVKAAAANACGLGPVSNELRISVP